MSAREEPASEIDTGNDLMVGAHGDSVVVLVPRHRLSPEQARRHAAWLVVVADAVSDAGPTFDEIRRAVEGT